MENTLAYSTSTNGVIVDNMPVPVQDTSAQDAYMGFLSEPHCFVCGRHTDHFGEHDDMVEAGTARYDDEGNVYPVPWAWDR